MTQDNIRLTVSHAEQTMLDLIAKFSKHGAEGINTLAITLKAISHILADQLKEYNDINNVQVWVMRSADTGEVWGKFNDLTEAIDAKMRYEKMDLLDGIYRVDMYLISQEPLNTK
jgi:uncharacterized protein YigE (DUF2233 family)